MKKQIKKVSVIALASMMSFGAFTACGGGFSDGDENTLYVGVYDSGIDGAWLDVVADMYEAEHPDITIEVVKKKMDYEAQNLQNTIETDIEDMYYTHIMPVRTWAEEGLILDITDVMQSKAVDTEDKTIEAKCTTPSILDFFKKGDKYYGMPFYGTTMGAYYDVDLFEQYGLYLKQGGGYTAWDPITETVVGTKTVGRDGVAGTSDDGLPVTYAEFKSWCDYLATQKGVTPFTWSYVASSNRNDFLRAWMANYEGKNDFELNYSLSGTDSQFGAITVENGYQLLGQRGKEFMATVAYDIIKKKDVWFKEDQCFETKQTHIMAQEDFLYSRPEGSPIAMLLDGGWWENEAYKTGIFDDIVDEFDDESYAFGKRRFALMSVPLFDENHYTQSNTLLNGLAGTSIIINAKTTKADLAKDFLRFTSTKEAMRIFNKETGGVRPFEYELSGEELGEMSELAKSTYEVMKNPNSTIATNLSTNQVMSLEADYFYNWFWKSKIGTQTFSDMFNTFYNNPTITVADYIQGGKDNYANWNAQLGSYFNN